MRKYIIALIAVVVTTTTTLAANDNAALVPDVNRSEIIAIDAVGDMLGDGGQIGVTVRDVNGTALKGVSVSLRVDKGDAVLTSLSGVTDSQGKFSSWLFSKVMTVAMVSATIDTDNDGIVDTVMNDKGQVAFVDSLMFNNGVGINIENPDDSAVLHVNSSDRGVLIPRVALVGCSDRVTILDPALSLLVFNTNGSDSLDIGYVYFNGTDWVNFIFE